MPNFSYRCPNGHEQDLLRPFDVAEVPCTCGAAARRAEVNRIGVIGFTETPRDEKSYRREFADFKEASAEVDHHYTKLEDRGVPVKRPNLFRQAQQKARAMGAKIR